MNPLDRAVLDGKLSQYRVQRNFASINITMERSIGQNKYLRTLKIDGLELAKCGTTDREQIYHQMIGSGLIVFLNEVDEAEKNPE